MKEAEEELRRLDVSVPVVVMKIVHFQSWIHHNGDYMNLVTTVNLGASFHVVIH